MAPGQVETFSYVVTPNQAGQAMLTWTAHGTFRGVSVRSASVEATLRLGLRRRLRGRERAPGARTQLPRASQQAEAGGAEERPMRGHRQAFEGCPPIDLERLRARAARRIADAHGGRRIQHSLRTANRQLAAVERVVRRQIARGGIAGPIGNDILDAVGTATAEIGALRLAR